MKYVCQKEIEKNEEKNKMLHRHKKKEITLCVGLHRIDTVDIR